MPQSDAQRAVVAQIVAAPNEAHFGAVAERVGAAVARAEPDAEAADWAERFTRRIAACEFLPSVPILANAGRSDQLGACYVLEPDDSLDGIYRSLGRAARIQQGSGGVGIHLSRLRPRGSSLERSGGTSPGPVAFAELFAASARVNALAGRRPGAHLVVLSDDHPDVLDFVRAKRERPDALASVGLALGVTDRLLEAARRDAPHTLHDRRGDPVDSIPARGLLREVAQAIRETGNPTLLFLAAIERANPVPHLGALEATNPCGEQPLLPDETCVLGSLQLPAFASERGELDARALARAACDAVRFLDDVVETHRAPDPRIAEVSLRTRKVGLGIMGFADWLLLRGVAYGSSESEKLASEVMAIVAEAAQQTSRDLAQTRGPFPAWRPSSGPRRRNASLLAIAPTGTLRLIAGCSGGLEPFLEPVFRLRRADGAPGPRWRDRWLVDWIDRRGIERDALLAGLESGVASEELPGLDERQRTLLRRAWEIPPESQIALQARFQAGVDGAVSKTVHLPAAISLERIGALIAQAHDAGCKGVAFYCASCAGEDATVQLGATSARQAAATARTG